MIEYCSPYWFCQRMINSYTQALCLSTPVLRHKDDKRCRVAYGFKKEQKQTLSRAQYPARRCHPAIFTGLSYRIMLKL